MKCYGCFSFCVATLHVRVRACEISITQALALTEPFLINFFIGMPGTHLFPPQYIKKEEGG